MSRLSEFTVTAATNSGQMGYMAVYKLPFTGRASRTAMRESEISMIDGWKRVKLRKISLMGWYEDRSDLPVDASAEICDRRQAEGFGCLDDDLPLRKLYFLGPLAHIQQLCFQHLRV